MNISSLIDLIVVIRCAGEATDEACYNLVRKQVSEEQIVTIKEKPFSQAVKKTFKIGLDSGKKWTLAIDADILLLPDAIENLVAKAESLSDGFFMIQGKILDKLFCGNRQGGPHLYRSTHLKTAIKKIPDDDLNLRPESYTYHEMAKLGYHYYHGMEIYGIHDYYQYPKDIYRKAFVHAHKHSKLIAYFIKEWMNRKELDATYATAIEGLLDGISSDKARSNIDFFKNSYKDRNSNFKNLKNDIDVKRIVKSEIISEDARNLEMKLFPDVIRSDYTLANDSIPDGFIKKLVFYMGNSMIRIGNFIKRMPA